MMDFATKFWPLLAGVLVVVAPNLYTFLKGILGKIKLPSLKSKEVVVSVDLDDLTLKDQKAIDWLANRAVEFSDDKLIMEMESVNTKFYHIHRIMRKPVTGPK
jgi:hypothetical protein